MPSTLGILGLWPRLIFFVAASTLPVSAYPESPTDPLQQHYSSAQTFQLGGDLDRAEAEYDEVLPLLQRIANLAAANDDLEEASRLLEESVAADPAYLHARTNLALIYYRSVHVDKAAAEAAEVVKADAATVAPCTCLGVSSSRSNRRREAARTVTKGQYSLYVIAATRQCLSRDLHGAIANAFGYASGGHDGWRQQRDTDTNPKRD